jgi:hypothetical protein
VVFISLSTAGWHSGELPSTQFLKEWKQRHRIPDTFVVAASPRDAGRDFYDEPELPNTVIVDPNGNLAFKKVDPGASGIIDAVKQIAR